MGKLLSVQISVLFHPVVVENFAEIVASGVGENDHDALRFGERGCVAERGGERGSGRAAGENSLFADQAARGAERFAVGNAEELVDDFLVVSDGEIILADAFNLVGVRGVAGEDGAFGVCADDLQRRVLLFEEASGSGDGSAGSDAADKRVNLSFCVRPDLGAGGEIVGGRVVQVFKLRRTE